jgi:hypothetical protein
MFYYRHHTDTDALQYVRGDVPLKNSVPQTFYYTHHSDMDAAQYVQADVSSGAVVA